MLGPGSDSGSDSSSGSGSGSYSGSVSEFNELEPRLKSAKNRFPLSTGLNLERLNTILSKTNHF